MTEIQAPYGSAFSFYEHALVLAAKAHRDQVRKGTDIPYVTHPVHVAHILALAGFDADLVNAGLLHDVIEDAGVSYAEIAETCGFRVADLVASVTEEKTRDGAKIPWEQRKAAKLRRLEEGSRDTAALAAADALHNAHALVSDVARLGDTVWSRFNAPRDRIVWYYGEVLRLVRATLGDEPLVGDLEGAVRVLEAAAARTDRSENELGGLTTSTPSPRTQPHARRLTPEEGQRSPRRRERRLRRNLP